MIKNWFIVVCQEWSETLLVPNWYHNESKRTRRMLNHHSFFKRSNMARWPMGCPGQDVMSNAKLSALPWLAVLVIQASCLYATLWPRQQNNSAMGRICLVGTVGTIICIINFCCILMFQEACFTGRGNASKMKLSFPGRVQSGPSRWKMI